MKTSTMKTPETPLQTESTLRNREAMRQRYPEGLSPADEDLLLSFAVRDLAAAQAAIASGADPDVMLDGWGERLAALAVWEGCPEFTELLLDAGADPLARNPMTGEAELPFALCALGPASLLQRVMLQYPVPPHLDDGVDDLAVHAAEAGRVDCLRVLREAGAELFANDAKALCRACDENQAAAVHYLVNECGAPLEQEYDDWSPLFYAARSNALDCARILLLAGANPLHEDICDGTPLSWAATDDMHQLLSSLLPGKGNVRKQREKLARQVAECLKKSCGFAPEQD